jgi:hypothetical protein
MSPPICLVFLWNALDAETELGRNNETIKKNGQRAFVESNPNRTAIIANIGAWMHNMEEYQEGFYSLVSWIDSFHPSKFLAFYREMITGHPGCKPHVETGQEVDYDWIHPIQEESYVNYESLMIQLNNNNTTIVYGYDLFEAFNSGEK